MLRDDLGRSLTFAEFAERAESVAAALCDQGFGAGTVVSWQLPTCVESVVLMAALARCHAVQNPILPILRDAEVGAITSQVRPDLVIVPARGGGGRPEGVRRRVLTDTSARILVCDIP